MQLVGSTGEHGGAFESRSSSSVTRLRPHLAASVALVGAGLIAVNPVAPAMGADIVHRAVHLTTAAADLAAATDPLSEWSTVLTEAATNISQIGGEIQADPLPALAEVIANQLAFSDTLDTNLQSLVGTVNTLVTDQLPQAVQALIAGIDAGDISSAVNMFTSTLGADLLPALNPFADILSIPGEMIQNLANVLTDQLPGLGLEFLVGPLGPLFGTAQALADDSQSIVDAVDGGQYSTALTDLLDMPAIATGAFLNGYDATSTFGIAYDGLLSSAESSIGSGILDDLLVQIPQQIATTLADGGTPATLAADLTTLLSTF